MTELADEVSRALSDIDWSNKSNPFKASEWTADIKSHLATLGFNHNFSVWASGIEEQDNGRGRTVCQEWLFDMVWIDYDGRDLKRRFQNLALALESELPTDKTKKATEVLDDFEKLIIARADLKVMVFQVDECSQAETEFQRLEQHARGFEFQGPDGTYLLAAIVWQNSKFLLRSFSLANGV